MATITPIRTAYRPSNGSEGEWFFAEYCQHCVNDSEESPCEILSKTFWLDIDDPEYPKEWVVEGRTPRCTAFKAK